MPRLLRLLGAAGALLAAVTTLAAQAAVAAATVDGVQVNVAYNDGTSKLSASASFPSKLSKHVSLSPADKATVSVKLTDNGDGDDDAPLAEQVVLVLAAPNGPDYTLVLEKARSAAKYENTLDGARPAPGEYSATVYCSGGRIAKPVAYALGSWSVEASALATAGAAAPSAEADFTARPEIRHVFRRPEKMPWRILSITFADLVLAPWLLLAYFWLSIGVNFKNLWATSSTAFWGIGFLASLAATLGLYFVYWVRLTIFEFLGYGTILWLVTAFLGWRALVARAAARLAEKN